MVPVAFLACLLVVALSAATDGVDISEIQVVHLEQGRMTAARRTNPIPQLNCVSGCDFGYLPREAACRNLGWTGSDFAWKCDVPGMPTEYDLTDVTVSCEGISGPGDRVVLPGSCALFYGLSRNYEQRHQQQRSDGPVRLQDVPQLYFSRHHRTQSRRGETFPQLECRGGCHKVRQEPSSATCRNVGYNHGSGQVMWECELGLPDGISLGSVEVVCEGYDGPGDSMVLSGSCQLLYTLDGTGAAYEQQEFESSGQHHHHGRQRMSGMHQSQRHQRHQSRDRSRGGNVFHGKTYDRDSDATDTDIGSSIAGGGFFIILALVGIVAMLACCCFRTSTTTATPHTPPTSTPIHTPTPSTPGASPKGSSGDGDGDADADPMIRNRGP